MSRPLGTVVGTCIWILAAAAVLRCLAAAARPPFAPDPAAATGPP